MAPLFGESNEMKELGKQMQNLSEQIATLKQQLAQKNTEVENLQKQLGETKSAAPSASDTAQLQRAQNEISSLRQQLDMLQAQAKQASQTPGAGTTSAASGGVKSATAGMAGGATAGAATQDAPATAGGLTVGGSAWVTRAGGLPLRMRSGPSLNANVLDRLAPGTQMTLLAGPQNADGHAWWHMRTADGREGWVAGEDLRVQPD